jgi:hypothetical protein
MKNVESLIIPRSKPDRTVVCFGVTYVFKQIVPGRFVAVDVADPAAEALIATGSYREFTDQLTSTLAAPAATKKATTVAPTAATAAAPATPSTAPVVVPAAPPAGEGDTQKPASDGAAPDAETLAAAQQLLSGAPAAVKKQAATAPRPVVEAALQLEKADKRPRATVVKSLDEALAAAG